MEELLRNGQHLCRAYGLRRGVGVRAGRRGLRLVAGGFEFGDLVGQEQRLLPGVPVGDGPADVADVPPSLPVAPGPQPGERAVGYRPQRAQVVPLPWVPSIRVGHA
jgi:hypothetical protein